MPLLPEQSRRVEETIRNFRQIKPTSADAALDMNTASLALIRLAKGEDAMLMIFAAMIADAAALLNIGKQITVEQMRETARVLYIENHYLTVADVQACISLGLGGSFGKIYDRFDVMVLGEWFSQYRRHRDGIVESRAAKEDWTMPKEGLIRLIEIMKRAEASKERVKELEKQADEINAGWYNSVFDTEVKTVWFKTVKTKNRYGHDIDAEVVCDSEDVMREWHYDTPVKVMKPDGPGKLLKRLIYQYVAFLDTAITVDIFEEISKRKIINDGWVSTLLASVEAYRRENTFSLFERAFGSQYVEAAEIQSGELYYSEYLPDCISKSIPPMRKNEYSFFQALYNYTIVTGEKNPVLSIIQKHDFV